MIVDGNSLAHRLFDDLKDRVAALPKSPRLTVLTCAPNFETQKFLTIKRKQAERLGIQVNIVELQEDIDTEECVDAIADAVRTSDGIVVQLPFPVHVERSTLIAAIPNSHDVDAFNLDDPEILPPVVGAIKEILISEGIDVVRDRRVVVVGNGALVGMPAATWFRKNGALVESVTLASTQITEKTKGADIIVLGAGSPHLLTPEMINEGVIILDAGTSEEGGQLKGDADPRCAEKASLFTPVPGGIGPVTVLVLLRNLVILTSRK